MARNIREDGFNLDWCGSSSNGILPASACQPKAVIISTLKCFPEFARTVTRSGRLRVAGTTTSTATNVTVNSTNAIL